MNRMSLRNNRSFSRNLENILQDKLKDVKMQPVGLGNTRISTDYAQKRPQILLTYIVCHMINYYVFC